MSDKVRCDRCGIEYGVGDSPWCRDSHARTIPGKGFEPRFDIGLGHDVTGWGDIHKHMRQNNLDYRDHPTAGETSARRDRMNDLSKRR